MKEFIEKLIGRLERNAFPLTYNFRTEKYLKFDKAKEIVKDLAEEYKGGWIPVSERLPDEWQTVLVQDFEDYYEVCNCETKQGVKGFSSGDWWASANNYIAWMPLPAPYKEGCE
jgi:hypothetical protein